MITYKNISFSAKTFYGVKFNPGDVKSVPGYINSPSMIRIFDVKPEPIVTPEPILETVVEEVLAEPTPTVTRGRKKKSTESEKDSFAETTENKIISEEETANGN